MLSVIHPSCFCHFHLCDSLPLVEVFWRVEAGLALRAECCRRGNRGLGDWMLWCVGSRLTGEQVHCPGDVSPALDIAALPDESFQFNGFTDA